MLALKKSNSDDNKGTDIKAETNESKKKLGKSENEYCVQEETEMPANRMKRKKEKYSVQDDQLENDEGRESSQKKRKKKKKSKQNDSELEIYKESDEKCSNTKKVRLENGTGCDEEVRTQNRKNKNKKSKRKKSKN